MVIEKETSYYGESTVLKNFLFEGALGVFGVMVWNHCIKALPANVEMPNQPCLDTSPTLLSLLYILKRYF